MLKKIYLFNLLMLIGMGSLVANYSNESDGQWRVFGEYLYFQPSVGDDCFVFDEETFSSNDNNRWESGWRIGAGYTFCGCGCKRDLLAVYTDFNFTHSRHGHSSSSSSSSDSDSSESSRHNLKFNYQRLDILYAQQLFNCCGLEFGVAAGLEAVELNLKRHHHFEGSSRSSREDLHHRSRTNGIGPEVGFCLKYDLMDCNVCCPSKLALKFGTSGSLLAATNRTHHHESSFHHKNNWRVVPALHSRVGLNYDMCFSECWSGSLEIGYEFSSYINGLARQDTDGCRLHEDFDLQGLYVALSLGF